MYARVIKSESLLVVVEKVIFIDEILDTVQDQFSKILEQMGRHWSVVIYCLLRIFLCTWNYVADMYKNIRENDMTFQKQAKTHFGQHLVYCSKQYFEISGKIYYHGNDKPNTPSPDVFRSGRLKM